MTYPRARARRAAALVTSTALVAGLFFAGTPAAAEPGSDPTGTLTIPVADSGEESAGLYILAASAQGVLAERSGTSAFDGTPGPRSLTMVRNDGSLVAVPDQPYGYRSAFHSGGILTSWSDNPTNQIHRRVLATGEPAPGDGTENSGDLVAAVPDGWVEQWNGMDGLSTVLHRPGKANLVITPTETRPDLSMLKAESSDIYWAEPAWKPTRIMRLDTTTDVISPVHESTAPVRGLWVTPQKVVWHDSVWVPEQNASVAHLCWLPRSGLAEPTCAELTMSDSTFLLGVTDTSVVWRVGGQYEHKSLAVAPLSAPSDATPLTLGGSGVTTASTATTAGNTVYTSASPLSDLLRFGGSAQAEVAMEAERLPADEFAIALSAGRLVTADNREFIRAAFDDWPSQRRYKGWERKVSRGAVVTAGEPTLFSDSVFRGGFGSAVAVSGARSVFVSLYDRNHSPTCEVTVADAGRASRTFGAMQCEAINISGPYYTRQVPGPPWGYTSIYSVDGRELQRLTWPTAGTVDIYGSRAVYVDRDGNAMLRDLARPQGTGNPRVLRASSGCWSGEAYKQNVAIWGRHAVVAPSCTEESYIHDLVTGAVRKAPAMWNPQLDDGAVVYGQPNGTGLYALDLTNATSQPVKLGDVAFHRSGGEDYRPKFSLDDHLVAWQDAVSGAVKVAPLPFGQSMPHAPRLLGTVAPSVLAVKASGEVAPWHAEFDVTKPLASWRVDLRNPAGTVVKSFTGTAPLGGIRLDWDGRLGSRWAPGGRYTWTLTGTAADGEGTLRNLDGQAVPLAGSLTIKDAKVRDLGTDRLADLLGRDGAGDVYRFNGKSPSGFTTRVKAAASWGKYSIVTGAGDLTGDGRPDVVARDAVGDVWRYDGTGTGTFRTRVKIGAGWGKYSAVIGPGDLTGDGRADVLARDTAGTLWRYDGTGVGTLRARVQVGGGWDRFNAIAAVGDFTSDGRPDLVVRDAYGYLYRYDGTGTGTFKPRVRIGSSWRSYSQLTGLGDLDGDGQSDLLARDSAGTLWRYPGNGKGGFLPRVSLGTAFKGYNRLF